MCVHVRLQWHSGWASVYLMPGVRGQTNVVLLHEACPAASLVFALQIFFSLYAHLEAVNFRRS